MQDVDARPVNRCSWAESSAAMRAYHDDEWGVPSRDDAYLFEMLVLEGAQAGLSWSIVLAKRESYRRAFDGFDARRMATYDDDRVGALLEDPGIVRNRLKVRAAVGNARAFLAIQSERGSFAEYLWSFVGGVPVVHRPRSAADVPVRSELADVVAKDLRRRGFNFVGPTIAYAYLQAVGVIDDHLVGCPSKRA